MTSAGVKIGMTAVVVGLLMWWQYGRWDPVDDLKPVKVLLEIDQLQESLQRYRASRQEFPPCLAEADPQTRQVRFLKHLELAFPNAHYGRTVEDFDRLQTQIAAGFGDDSPGYNFQAATTGDLQPLDLNTLDAAESLPFWLGGFPTPLVPATKRPVTHRRLFGFHRDSDAPLKRNAPSPSPTDEFTYRSEQFYPFDPERLVDQDGDGWLEYVPRRSRPGELIAPSVYFDGEAYAGSSTQAALLGTVRYPAGGALAKTWGYAMPYLTRFDPARPTEAAWANAASFQIVTAGSDNLYAPIGAADARRLVVIPDRTTFLILDAGQFEERRELLAEERDNVTNLADDTLAATSAAAK